MHQISHRIGEEVDDGQSHVSEHARSQRKESRIERNVQCPHRSVHHQKRYGDVSVRQQGLDTIEEQTKRNLDGFASR